MYSKFHNPNNEITPGSTTIRTSEDSNIIEISEETFGRDDEEFSDTKDFEVVRVDKGNDSEEDVEIIEVSCCPRIRFSIQFT